MEIPNLFYRLAKFVSKKIPYLEKHRDSVAWKVWRHQIALMIDRRENSTFTGFLRSPSQFEALNGPVVNYLTKQQPRSPLRIVVMGCSNGAEAFTIASILTARTPAIEFLIDAYDINGEIVEKAQSACFHADEVLNNKIITSEFVRATFDIDDDTYRVKKDVAARVTFRVADVLSADLVKRAKCCDILFAQNFLFHLDPKNAIRAFENLCRLLKPRAVLFADGMDLGIRQKWTRIQQLVPLDFRIEEIHNEARRARAVGWPENYWGLEPFMTFATDWQRRYATIFLKDQERDTSLRSG
jgi:chemotaxis methyl-accepting protein methylase